MEEVQRPVTRGGKDVSETWIINEHGVKSSKPKWMAEMLLADNPDWSYTEPEPVPKVKQYPVKGELTATGLANRTSINERREILAERKAEADNKMSYKDLQKAVSKLGVPAIGKKKEELESILEKAKT